MEKQLTQLTELDDKILRLIHLSERFRNTNINLSAEVFDYPTEDCFVVICKYDNQYLLGKLRTDYEFCPGDWGFLTLHTHRGDEWKEKALWTSEYYAGLKPTQIIRAYHTFMWLDLDSQLWWNFIPFKVEVESGKFILDPDKKYSEFKWVKKKDFPKYSREGYLEHVCNKTLDADHLYVDNFTTIFDKHRGFYNFFPYQK